LRLEWGWQREAAEGRRDCASAKDTPTEVHRFKPTLKLPGLGRIFAGVRDVWRQPRLLGGLRGAFLNLWSRRQDRVACTPGLIYVRRERVVVCSSATCAIVLRLRRYPAARRAYNEGKLRISYRAGCASMEVSKRLPSRLPAGSSRVPRIISLYAPACQGAIASCPTLRSSSPTRVS
jgi:hypothetical protein